MERREAPLALKDTFVSPVSESTAGKAVADFNNERHVRGWMDKRSRYDSYRSLLLEKLLLESHDSSSSRIHVEAATDTIFP